MTCGGEVPSSELTASEFDPQAIGNPKNIAWVRPTATHIQCIMAPCPVYLLQGVNGATSHAVDRLDLKALNLPEKTQTALLEQVGGVLLHGRYAQDAVGQSTTPQPITFVVDNALSPVVVSTTEKPASNRYYQVVGNDIRCIRAPCPTMTATLLGTAQQELWADVDLSPLGLSAAAEKALHEELRQPEGTVKLSLTSGTVANRVTEAFRPFGAKPLPQ